MTSRQAALHITAVLVVIACLARVVNLNADPSVSTWIGYVIDEGRWNEIARNLALFGTPEGTPNARLHLILTPAYQAVNYAVFRLVGVDFWSARLLAAICGILTVAVTFFALRRHIAPPPLALGVVILGFESNLLSESRMALPEIPSVFFTLIAFFLLVLGQKTRRNALVAGLLVAMAVGMKATTIVVMPAFPLIILLTQTGDTARRRVARAFAFVAGFTLLAATGLAAALAFGLLTGNANGISGIFQFMVPTTPYVAVMRFFDSPDLEARNLLLLGAWFCSWIWFHRNASAPMVVRELYLASAIWAAWWLLAWSGSQYLPGRYVVHLIVPLTIHIMAGLTLAGHDTFARIADALGRRRGWRRALSLAWLVLPSAVYLGALAAGFAGISDWDSSSLSRRIALIAVLTGVLEMAIWRRGPHPAVTAAFLWFPVWMTALWLASRELGVVAFFWHFESTTSLAIWTALSALTFAACIALARYPQDPRRVGIAQVAGIGLLAAIFFAQSVPAIVRPTYSIRNASLDLQQRFTAGAEVRTFSAESLFLANQLKFRAYSRGESSYDGIVIFEHGLPSRLFLANRGANLVRVETYPLQINPRYLVEEDRYGPASIAVYKPR